MTGKVLKIVSNDLYGNVDDRQVVVFSAFCHTKYMNNYVVFAFLGEYGKKKLCYGSLHIKNNSLVIFSVRDNVKKYIEEFLDEYVNDKVENFEILDISKMEKVELVSYSEMDFDNLELLDEKSIPKIKVNDEKEREKKPVFLYCLLLVLILSSVGLTILYFNPELFTVKYKQLVCSNSSYDKELMLNYDMEYDVKFDKEDKVESINVSKLYNFLDSNIYYDFKDNNRHEDYFKNGEAYKYIDDGLQLKIMYKEDSVIDDYDEMFEYLKREGFSCIEKEYEK